MPVVKPFLITGICEVAAGVALRGLMYFTIGYGIEDLEQAVLRVRVASPIGNIRVHEVAVGLLVDLAC